MQGVADDEDEGENQSDEEEEVRPGRLCLQPFLYLALFDSRETALMPCT